MSKEYGRNRRVAELIKHELAHAVVQRFPINKYGLITVSAVDVSPDLKNAKIYITCLGENNDPDVLVNALNEHSGYFRTIIAKAMTSKGVPKITFRYDESIARGERLSSLIETLDRQKAE